MHVILLFEIETQKQTSAAVFNIAIGGEACRENKYWREREREREKERKREKERDEEGFE